MKNLRKFVVTLAVLLVALLCLTATVSAAEIVDSGTCGDNLTWTLDDEGTLTISGDGAMKNYNMNGAPWDDERANVKQVIIENGVTSIGDCAFYKCNKVTDVTIPNSVTQIGHSVFTSCKKITNITIPNGVTSIGEGAFSNCTGLTSVTLPDSLTCLNFEIFRDCSNLSSITFPENVTRIDEDAFRNCSSLVEIVIPDSVTDLGAGAFMGCSSAVIAYLPANLQTVPAVLFNSCSSLEAVFLPASVTEIGSGAFYGCDALAEIYYLGDEEQLAQIQVGADNDPLLYANVYLVTVITKEPEDAYAVDGATVKFSTDTNRDGCTFQWYYLAPNADEWKPCKESSAKKKTLTITAKEKLDGYYYCCEITDPYGNVGETRAALLSIVEPPKITTQPKSVAVPEGTTAKVTVKAKGDGLTYQWYIKNAGKDKFSKSSTTSASYSVKMSEKADGREVYCVVKDQYGNTVKSKTVTLYMGNGAKITTQPKSTAAAEGKVAKTTVKATGDGLSYQWYIRNPGKTKFGKSSVTSATYSCKMSESTDGREAYCVITDKYGTSVQTNTVTLYMGNPAKITAQPKDAAAAEGATAKATVKASGDGLTYQWYIRNSGKTKFGKSSVTSANYSCKMSESTDGREAYCVITDKYGTSVQTNTVTFRIGNPPQIVKQPVSVSGKNGETVQTTVEATGEDLTYQWYIKNAGKTKFSKSSVTSATYSVAVSEKSDGREAYCVITDKYGMSVQSETVTITMIKEEVHTHTLQTLEIQPTCTEAGKIQTVCAECGEVLETVENPEKPALDHDWVETSNTATCTADGTKTSECSRCLSFKTESAPATGHVSTHVETKEPTCTVNGWEKTICDKCGEQVGATDVLPAPGEHTHEAAVVADAAKEYREHWSSENYADYLGYTDIVCQRCAVCYEIDETSFAYKYSAEEVTAMMLEHVNALRAEAGLAALTAGADQVTLAGTRAQEIAVNFTQSSGHKENIAKATTLSDCVLNFYNAFLESADQKANLLAEDVATFGCAIYYQDGAVYCVQIFA